MTGLDELLREAAPSDEPRFTAADVRERVTRRRRRRMATGLVGVVLVALVVGVGALALEGRDDADDVVAGPGGDEAPSGEAGAITQDELTSGRWVLTAVSGVTVSTPEMAWIEFLEDGTLSGHGGCNGFGSSTWSLDGDRLVLDDVVSTAVACPQNHVEGNILDVLRNRPTVGRFDGQPDTLRLDAGGAFIAFRKVGAVDPPCCKHQDPPFDTDPALRWSVVLERPDDVLLREQPDARSGVVAELPAGTEGLAASTEVRSVDGEPWRQVQTPDGSVGWVSDRHLAAQPADFGDDDREEMTSQAQAMLSWLADGSGPGPEAWLSDRGLWVGGIGIYADMPTPFTPISAADLATRDGWTASRSFVVGDQECEECQSSVIDFLHVEQLGSSYSLVVDDLDPDNVWQDGPVEPLLGAHAVTADKPLSSDQVVDWLRLTMWFEWSSGQPRIFAAQIWGWTP